MSSWMTRYIRGPAWHGEARTAKPGESKEKRLERSLTEILTDALSVPDPGPRLIRRFGNDYILDWDSYQSHMRIEKRAGCQLAPLGPLTYNQIPLENLSFCPPITVGHQPEYNGCMGEGGVLNRNKGKLWTVEAMNEMNRAVTTEGMELYDPREDIRPDPADNKPLP